MKFGTILRRNRDYLGLSRRSVAEKSGLNEQYIYDIETDRKNPSLETINKLAKAYKNPNLVTEFLKYKNIIILDKDNIIPMFDKVSDLIKNNPEARREFISMAEDFIKKYEKNKMGRCNQ